MTDQVPALVSAYRANSQWDVLKSFDIQPLSDLHYDTETGIFDFTTHVGHKPTLFTLSAIAILLLAIGAINFINLETAQAMRRAKEVGVRKVLGSTRTRLVVQFVCEGMLVTLAAVLLAVPLTEVSLHVFSEFVPEGVTLNLLGILPVLLALVVFIGLLASAYPAFILSQFLPAVVLKSQSQGSASSRGAFMRQVLIVFQFTVAQVLILGTLMVGTQIRYMLNKDLGFRKDAIVYFNAPREGKDAVPALRHELETLPGVAAISLSEAPPAYNGWSSSRVEYDNGFEKMSIDAFRKFGDEHYVSLYRMEILAGSNLQPSDTIREFLINETMAHELGFDTPEEAIGTRINFGNQKIPVAGVVKDFHTQSLRSRIDPLIMANTQSEFRCFNLRLATDGADGTTLDQSLEAIGKAWKKAYPDTPFKYDFLDDTIRNFYNTEQRVAKLAYAATGLAIFISCLGLFGLASYTTLQRTREIGVRKIFGASVQQIIMLLSKDFVVLVVVAFVVTLPVAWFSMTYWLQGFSYHADPKLWMFIFTMFVAMAVAMVTVGYQTFKASSKNPVDSLRHE